MVANTDRPAAFKASLAALNAQFAAWVASSAASAPHALWTDAARDYVKHAAGLVEEYKDVLGGGGGAPAQQPAPAPPASGLFGAAAPPPAPAPAPFNFGGQPASGGLFGGPPPAPAAGGLFGAPPAGGFGGFSGFGAAAPAVPPPAEEEDEEEEEEATPAALDVGAAMAFKASNARVHAMTPGTKAWVDRGRGVLTVRSPASGEDGAAAASSARPHVVFTTDTGRVLLNAVLYKGLVVGKARKPHMVTATLANAAALAAGSEDGEGGGGGSGGGVATALAPHLFTLASEEEADAFMAALKEAVAKHCA